MKKAAITYSQFFNRQGTARALGGVETYIYYLSKLLVKMGFEVVIYQSSDVVFEKVLEGVKVIGVKHAGCDARSLYNAALSFVEEDNGVLIFGADQHSVKTNYDRAINIMHGIAWDLPADIICKAGGRYKLIGKIPKLGQLLAKRILGNARLKQIENTKHCVLVDYNSINWYRTQVHSTIQSNYKVILNFASFPGNYQPDLAKHNDKYLRILFARRFQKFRGSEIMMDAVSRLIEERSDFQVVFAGEGPEKEAIENRFIDNPQVIIDSYLPEESIKYHEGFHIAVIPSLASEGSSLSLAEAMGAGCAVIASDVGGMTNMVIDGFNGYLIRPNATDLYEKLVQLLDSPELRLRLADGAQRTAMAAFSLEKWEGEWVSFVSGVME